MAIIYSYPSATPALSDIIIGTQFEGDGNATKSFSVADISSLILNQATIEAQPIKLSFNWTKAQRVISVSPIPNTYYKLGIDFNGLTLESGVEYTLLIDRWRYNEIKDTYTGKVRAARYYHELPGQAIVNGRFSELPITSASGQYFDFIPKNYFSQGNVEGVNPPFRSGSGKAERRSKTLGQGILYVNLSFRLRINRGGVIIETDILGTINLAATRPGGEASSTWTISYAYPKST